MSKFNDLTGQQFGRLVVISSAGSNKHKCFLWNCVCECGNESIVLGSNLRSGKTKSCGCYQRETIGQSSRTHGKCQSVEYSAWKSMQRRCRKESNYTDRGISVCDRWLESFENFYADMGDKPSPKHSLDRIDNGGNYTPENCRWATREEQNNNRRTTLVLTLDGISKPLSEWAIYLNLNYKTLSNRQRKGWSDEEILTTPIKNAKPKGEQVNAD